ncbi:MAG: hypothetical protein IT270_19320 [Saprospiraceae bacterium]|nr:hypothetical protein [Saprospiraceae bacterium]
MKFIFGFFSNCSTLIVGVFAWLAFVAPAIGQNTQYFPKGDPDQWTVSLTPFLVLPNISGSVQSSQLSQDFDIGPADFINSLNGTFMMDAEISKGTFFASPAYIYTYNEVEKIFWESDNTNQSIQVEPSLIKHVVEVIGGMRKHLAHNFIMDPFVGIRYTSYHVFGPASGIVGTSEIDEHEDFWDPIIGVQIHYYPHPRVPIELKTDIGGFGMGSQFTWSAFLHSGYTISPGFDILAGFAGLGNVYEGATKTGSNFGLSSIIYGFDLGFRFYIPGRFRDPNIFKPKDKK